VYAARVIVQVHCKIIQVIEIVRSCEALEECTSGIRALQQKERKKTLGSRELLVAFRLSSLDFHRNVRKLHFIC